MNDIENPTPESEEPVDPAGAAEAEPAVAEVTPLAADPAAAETATAAAEPAPVDPAAAAPASAPVPSAFVSAASPQQHVLPPAPRRRTWVPIVGALAAGALFGAAAGAGTALLVSGSSGSTTAGPAPAAPQTITVNDTTSVNAVTAVAASAMDSVVTISVTDEAVGAGSGSGVVLDDEGHIVTNTHVVTLGGATADPVIKVTTSAGRVYPAKLIGTDPLMDLAVIQVTDAPELAPIEFADSDDLNVGDLTIAIGAPLGYAGTVTSGIISALDRSIQVQSSAAPEDDAPDSGTPSPFGNFRFDLPGVETAQPRGTIQLPVIQTDTAINPGNSGGALLDANGRLIGINVAIASTGSGGNVGVGFAIPSNTVSRIASELVDTGEATHGLFGVTVVDVAQDPAQSDAGIVGASVKTVAAGGAAASAGIQPGDIIVSLDGIPITSRNDLTAQVRTHGVGEVVKVVYVRGGQTNTVDVTLGDLDDYES